MTKRWGVIWGCSFLVLWGSSFIAAPMAQANCADTIVSEDYAKLPMRLLFAQLARQTAFPWGAVQPYDAFAEDRILLKPEFDPLPYAQKLQVLQKLNLGYGQRPEDDLPADWQQLLTPAERQWIAEHPNAWIGATSPFPVFASDGRLVSAAYDGCTRMHMLTEKERFSWYYNRLFWEAASQGNLPAEIRNVGVLEHRGARFPIDAASEKAVRLLFWQQIGYGNEPLGWWIAWVPEQGYFEINTPAQVSPSKLEGFLAIAPKRYRYVVVSFGPS